MAAKTIGGCRIAAPRRTGRNGLAAATLAATLAGAILPAPAPAAEAQALRPPEAGIVRALIVGIDKYKNPHIVPTLQGAAADARDVSGTLAAAGVKDVTLLLDRQATRAALTKAFDGLARRAGPHDLIIVAFAGHGSQSVEHIRGSEPDGLDEFFVLSGFGNSGDDTRERLVDDEVFAWVGKFAARGAQILFLSDTCYGGGMTKAGDPAAGRDGLRGLRLAASPSEAGLGAYYIAPGDDRLELPAAIPPDDDATKIYPSFTFIAGADDRTQVPETSIPGESTPRGAASYAFSRALRGEADKQGDGNGVTTRAELMAYMRRQVSSLTGDRQRIAFEPRDASTAAAPLFVTGAGPHPAADPARAAAAPSAMITPDKPAPVQAGGATGPALQNVAIDDRTGNVTTLAGAVLAQGLAPDEIRPVAERFEAALRFEQVERRQPLNVSLSPNVRSFVEGDAFKLLAGGLYGRNLIIFDLASDGTVQLIFPAGSADPMQNSDAVAIPMRAEPPFGSDSLVLIATPRRARDLELDLTTLNGKKAALQAFEAVNRHLSPDDRLGLVQFRTRSKADSRPVPAITGSSK